MSDRPTDKPKTFRFANRYALLTYKTHLEKVALSSWFEQEFKAVEVHIAHETGDEEVNYLHSHVYVDFGKAYQTTNVLRFDYEGIHPHVKVLSTREHVANALVYLAKEDPDNAGLLDRRMSAFAKSVWTCKSLTEAMQNVSRASDVVGVREMFRMKPVERKVEPFEPREWQKAVLDTIETKPDDRTVYWVYDPKGGAGKSRLCRHVLTNGIGQMVTRFDGGRNAAQIVKGFIDSGWDGRCLLVDFARDAQEHQIYGPLEEIKNGVMTSTKYEGGTQVWDIGHVIVFANFLPDFTKMTADRWRVMDLSKGVAWIKHSQKDYD